jgi:hypothetical protein
MDAVGAAGESGLPVAMPVMFWDDLLRSNSSVSFHPTFFPRSGIGG